MIRKSSCNLNQQVQTFCFSAGVYRLARPLTPKDQQRLVGEPGAILSGAQVVTEWTQTAGPGGRPAISLRSRLFTENAWTVIGGCGYTEAVFYDDRQLWRVDTRDELTTGRFFRTMTRMPFGSQMIPGNGPSKLLGLRRRSRASPKMSSSRASQLRSSPTLRSVGLSMLRVRVADTE